MPKCGVCVCVCVCGGGWGGGGIKALCVNGGELDLKSKIINTIRTNKYPVRMTD